MIAAGGGAVLDETNMLALKRNGAAAYLRAEAPTISRNLSGDGSRPLLFAADKPARVAELLKIRGPLYEKYADFIIDVDRLDVKGVAGELLKEMRLLNDIR